MIKLPAEMQIKIRTRARNLLELHRINGKHSVGIDVVQRMLEIMGEQIAYDLIKAALQKVDKGVGS